MDDILLEPLKAYKDVYESKFDENVKNYFSTLVKKSTLNVEENRRTVKEYKQELAILNELKSKLKKQKILRGFLIFLAVAGFIMLGVGIYMLVVSQIIAGAILTSLGAVFAVVGITVTVTVINKKIKSLNNECDKQNQIATDIQNTCWKQMACLNKLFESNATKKLIEKTVPLLKLDDNFNMRRYDYLSGKYGFGDNADPRRSTIGILTGEILGNPFVVDRELVQSVGSETYTGTLLITWTTTYRDKDGRTQTQHHSQTLVATVTKPKPVYSEQTRLIYGNEAAPDLTFSRTPKHAEKMSEKELENKIKSGAKKIQKQQTNDMTDDDPSTNFTGMGNEEFDVLFGALDRDNEVQFRLLFTPLAQKNMLELMKSDYAYGDDFYFYKSKCLNYISSEHSRQWDLNTDYSRYQSYDVDDAFARFSSFNRNYFKSLFFDLAPLLAIPLYQQHKPHEYIYMDTYPRNYTSYESEYAVNKMGQNMFAHSRAHTNSILKTSFLKKDGNSDEVEVTAYSFTTQDRVEVVPTLGGDGRMHGVPVHWTEYIPVSQNSTVRLKQLGMTDKEFGAKLGDMSFKSTLDKYGKFRSYSHGILCCLTNSGDLSFDRDINEVLQ